MERIRLVPIGDHDHVAHAHLLALNVGGHTYTAAAWHDAGPNVELANCMSTTERQLDSHEAVRILVVATEPGPLRVRPVIECRYQFDQRGFETGATNFAYMGMWETDPIPKTPKRFSLPASNPRTGDVRCCWQSPWPCRPTHLYVRSDSDGDVVINEVLLSPGVLLHNRAHAGLPVELFFGAGASIGGLACTTLETSVTIFAENIGAHERWVEFEMDVDAFDRRDQHP